VVDVDVVVEVYVVVDSVEVVVVKVVLVLVLIVKRVTYVGIVLKVISVTELTGIKVSVTVSPTVMDWNV
jgi:hypothetical protein